MNRSIVVVGGFRSFRPRLKSYTLYLSHDLSSDWPLRKIY